MLLFVLLITLSQSLVEPDRQPNRSSMFSAKIAALAALLPATAFAASIVGNGSSVLSNGKYEISSEGIRAQFIPYGASITNLFIRDVHGIERDIVLGWDNATYYTEDKKHPHLG